MAAFLTPTNLLHEIEHPPLSFSLPHSNTCAHSLTSTLLEHITFPKEEESERASLSIEEGASERVNVPIIPFIIPGFFFSFFFLFVY